MERGIVSMRVGFVLRSAEIQPLVPAICYCESGLDRLCALFPRRAERHDAFRDSFALPPTYTTQPTPNKAKASPSIDGTFRKSKILCLFLRVSVIHPRRTNHSLLHSRRQAHFLRVLSLTPRPPDLRPKLLPRAVFFCCGFLS